MTELPGGPIGAARRAQAEREQRPAEHCGQADPSPLHSSHQFMRGGILYRCPGGAAERPPVRHTADTITDNDLDQLYARIATLEAVAESNKRAYKLVFPDLQAAEQRAEQAEAAIERVRTRCQAVRDRVGPSGMINATQILGLLSPTWPDGNYEAPTSAALDEPKEPRP